MKTMLFFVLSMICSSAMAQQKNIGTSGVASVIIEGSAAMLKDGTVIKFQPNNVKEAFDVIVKNGRVSKKIEGIDADVCTMTLNEKTKWIYLTPGVVKVSLADTLIRNAVVTGNTAAVEFEQLQARMLTDKASIDWAAYIKQSPARILMQS